MIDLLILSTLLPGPKHGYRLKQEAGLMLGQKNLHPNLIYPLLRRFIEQGWVKQKTAPGERGQTRKVYSLTPLGLRTLIERISNFSEQDARSEDAFQLRVGMFQLLPQEARERILTARQAALQAQDEHMASLQQNMPLGLYGENIVQHRREHTQAELAWVRQLRELQRSQATTKDWPQIFTDDRRLEPLRIGSSSQRVSGSAEKQKTKRKRRKFA